jgi:hypothetical protein
MGKRSIGDVNALKSRAFELADQGLLLPEIADLLGVSLRTIQRWRASVMNPETASSEDCQQTELIAGGISEQEAFDLDELIPISINVLQDILQNPDSKNSDKLRAVTILGDWTGLSSGISGSLRRVSEAGYVVIDPTLPSETSDDTRQGLTDEAANLIRAKLLGIIE